MPLSYLPLNYAELFRAAMLYSVAAWAVFLLLVAAALKGKPFFTRARARIGIWSLLLFAFCGYWLTLYCNSKFDSAPAAWHRAEVIRKYSQRSRNEMEYLVVVLSWRPGHQEEALHVSRRTYGDVLPGQTVATVLTKPGFLRHEWVKACRFDTVLDAAHARALQR